MNNNMMSAKKGARSNTSKTTTSTTTNSTATTNSNLPTPSVKSNQYITDEMIYTQLLPPFENCFDESSIPQVTMHQVTVAATALNTTTTSTTTSNTTHVINPVLSQEDLLGAIKGLSTSTKYDDVR